MAYLFVRVPVCAAIFGFCPEMFGPFGWLDAIWAQRSGN